MRPDPPQRCGWRGRGIPGGRGLPPPVGVRVTLRQEVQAARPEENLSWADEGTAPARGCADRCLSSGAREGPSGPRWTPSLWGAK